MFLKIFKNLFDLFKIIDENCSHKLSPNYDKFIKSNIKYIQSYILKPKYLTLFLEYSNIVEKKNKCIICNELDKIMNNYFKICKFTYIYYDKKYTFESFFIIKKCGKVIFNSHYTNSRSKIPKKYILCKTIEKNKYEINIYFKYSVVKNPIKPSPNYDLISYNKSQATSNFTWDTSTTTLFYTDTILGKCPVVLSGVSITTTQYLASLYSADTFYDFTSDTINANLAPLIDFLEKIPTTLSSDTINKFPCLRIPLCADYWLNGSAQSSVVNTYFSSQQYQNCIISIINSLYTSEYTTIILDLHWNYSTSTPQQSSNGTLGNNFDSGQQLPLCGVFLSDCSSGTNGTLSDNTLDFWKSIANIFGVDENGNELNANSVNSNIKKNIFFELYNEPFCDQLVNNPYEQYIPSNMYNTKYDLYINGGTAYLNNTCQQYSFTGFGVIYNELRNMNCYNIFVISAAENYAYYNFTSGDQWNYYYEGINPDVVNTLKNTYNCFTCLRDSIENLNGLFVKNQNGGNYASNNFINVLLNAHPYSGLYPGASKIGGYYNPSLGNMNNIPGLAQIISSFQNPLMDNFYMSSPQICTEYGMYDLPWSDYTSGNDKNNENFAYPSDYKNPLNATLGTPYYGGIWYDASGIQNIGPAIIPYCQNFTAFSVSFTAWAWRPNSGGNGDGVGCNQFAPGFGWDATQPDFASGSFSYSGNLNEGNACAGQLMSQIISSTTQDLNLEENLGCCGPDFSYLTDEYINGT
jgi:hypothetical protein